MKIWPGRPYTSSGAGSRVVLRHHAAATAVSCLTVDAAAGAEYGISARRLGPRIESIEIRFRPGLRWRRRGGEWGKGFPLPTD